MAKVKDIIAEYRSKWDIVNLHLIDTHNNEVCFSGDFNQWINCVPVMQEYKRQYENGTVINKIEHNDNTLFLFFIPEGIYYPDKEATQ